MDQLLPSRLSGTPPAPSVRSCGHRLSPEGAPGRTPTRPETADGWRSHLHSQPGSHSQGFLEAVGAAGHALEHQIWCSGCVLYVRTSLNTGCSGSANPPVARLHAGAGGRPSGQAGSASSHNSELPMARPNVRSKQGGIGLYFLFDDGLWPPSHVGPHVGQLLLLGNIGASQASTPREDSAVPRSAGSATATTPTTHMQGASFPTCRLPVSTQQWESTQPAALLPQI